MGNFIRHSEIAAKVIKRCRLCDANEILLKIILRLAKDISALRGRPSEKVLPVSLAIWENG